MPSPATILLHAEPASPELALVDPELRARLVARDLLFEELSGDVLAPAPKPVETGAAPPRGRRLALGIGVAAALSAAAAAGVYAVLLLPSEQHATPPLPSTPTAEVALRQVAAASTAVEAAPTAPAGRTFAWAPVPGARSYVVELARNDSVVYTRTTSATTVEVPAGWRHGGKRFALSAGRYRWYVWPLLGAPGSERRGPAAVSATLEIER